MKKIWPHTLTTTMKRNAKATGSPALWCSRGRRLWYAASGFPAPPCSADRRLFPPGPLCLRPSRCERWKIRGFYFVYVWRQFMYLCAYVWMYFMYVHISIHKSSAIMMWTLKHTWILRYVRSYECILKNAFYEFMCICMNVFYVCTCEHTYFFSYHDVNAETYVDFTLCAFVRMYFMYVCTWVTVYVSKDISYIKRTNECMILSTSQTNIQKKTDTNHNKRDNNTHTNHGRTYGSTSTWGVETGASLLTVSVADTTLSPSDFNWSTKESTSLALLPSFMARLGPEALTDDERVSYQMRERMKIVDKWRNEEWNK